MPDPARRSLRQPLLTTSELSLAGLVVLTLVSVVVLSTQIEAPEWLRNAALFGHLMALLLGFGSVLSVDWFGLLWLLRRVPLAVVIAQADRMAVPIWLGTMGLCATGALLRPDLHSPLTVVKMVCVLGVVLAGVTTISTKRIMVGQLPRVSRSVLVRGAILAGASQTFWWVSCLIGFMTVLERH
ncbi:MAG TPA: hypothetical protein VIT20_11200 [Propionibacteriaceae bacterium]